MSGGGGGADLNLRGRCASEDIPSLSLGGHSPQTARTLVLNVLLLGGSRASWREDWFQDSSQEGTG